MRWYLEHDGRVNVIERDGTLDLPTGDELEPGDHVLRATKEIRNETVRFAASRGPHDPSVPNKDDLVRDPRATPLLREAIATTLFRPVVSVVLRRGREEGAPTEDEVLLVRPGRGLAKDRWVLPGGFVEMWEQPDDAARREVREEVGLHVKDLDLHLATTFQPDRTPYPMLGIVYHARAWTGTVTAQRDEIAEARWWPVDERPRLRHDGLTKRALEGTS